MGLSWRDRIANWFRPELKPGICECAHPRCTHREGKGKCEGKFPPGHHLNPTNNWLVCACQCFVPDDDNGGGSDEPPTPNPSPEEVEKELAQYERC